MRSNFITESLIRQEGEEKHVCGECIREEFLNRHGHIKQPLFVPRVCIGCATEIEEAFSLSYLIAQCKKKLPNFYEPDDGLFRRPEVSLKDLLADVLVCSNEVVTSLLSNALVIGNSNEENDDVKDEESALKKFFAPDQSYQRQSSPFEDKEHERWFALGNWRNVAKGLSHGHRFFNKELLNLFDAIVTEALSARDPSVAGGRPSVRILPAATPLFRARIAHDRDELAAFKKEPLKCLGAPPKEKATNGRMSAAGIPSLYLSGDRETCVAEVRPSIADQVAVGRFKSTQELRLFDLTAFSEKEVDYPRLSIFDPSHGDRELARLLLSHLHIELGRAVKIHDTDYLMTQALAEYVRYYKDNGERFDGLAFHSVQKAEGVNYTLFDRSSDNERAAHDWKPIFDVQIDASDIEVVDILRVKYEISTHPEF